MPINYIAKPLLCTIYVTVSAKTCIVLHNFQKFFFSTLSTIFKEWVLKFQLNQASSFEVIALDSRASKKIDLYSNHTENKLQALTFAAITFVCICLWYWDLA